MTKIVVTSIISQNSYGVIVGGRDETDHYIRAILPVDACPDIDAVYEIKGELEEYKDGYGKTFRQIRTKEANRIRTSGRLVRPWLESIPGVGPTRSKRLLDVFGENILDYLGNSSHTDELVKALDPNGTALGEKLAAQVQAHFIAHRARENTVIAEVDFFLELEKCGICDRQAAKMMFRLIGNRDAFDRLMNRPYLAAELMAWKEADHLGCKLLSRRGEKYPLQHPERLAGACDSVWRDQLKKGHTAISLQDFLAALKNKRVNAQKALKEGIERRRVIEAGDLLRSPGAAYLEFSLASHLVTLINGKSSIEVPEDLEKLVRSSENSKRPLTDEQRKAVCGILRSKFAILQGGTGTGKTTTLEVVVDAWEKMGGNVILGAPSGKASLNLSRSTGKLAETLARHLINYEKNKIAETNNLPVFPIPTDKTLFVIDESSNVDLTTMYKLMFHIPKDARIVLVGDVAQLPPAGLGQVYHDLVVAGINVFWLSEPLRQKNESGTDITNPIIDVATDIRNGKVPVLPPFEDISTGAFLLDTDDTSVESCVVSVLDYIKGKVRIDEILVLASLQQTCTNINRSMAARKQKDGVEGIRLGILAPWVSQGDPIICTRNRYDYGLMNGQIGHINTFNPVTVLWDSDQISKPVEQSVFIDLAPAWAINCNRAQGSESRFVIVALDNEFLLSREWLYTAATRATQQVIFVGQTSSIEKAVKKRAIRTTCFTTEVTNRMKSYEHSNNER